jgi:FHS family L-fucose permease-like MFS transporter
MPHQKSSLFKYRLDLSVLTLLFFMWGFVTCLNDILIPHFKAEFNLTYFQAALIQFTFFFAYFVIAMPSGIVIDRLGYKKTLILGLVVSAVGALGFIPAAKLASYPFFLASLFTLASGITFLQVSANPYVTVIGPEDKASSRLNLTQAFNALGTTLAPIFGGILILSTTQGIDAVIFPYFLLAVILLALAVLFIFYHLPAPSVESSTGKKFKISDVFSYRHTVLGAVAIFVYVGAEVSIGSFLVNYFGTPEVLSLSHEAAAQYVAMYWGGAMVGRFIGSAILQKVDTGLLLGIFSLCAAALILLSISTSGSLAMYSVLAVGLFNSIMFPSIFTLGIAKLGKLTSIGSSLLVMAIVGGAILPLIVGSLADHMSLQKAFIVPVLCYIYLFYYGISGSKVRLR